MTVGELLIRIGRCFCYENGAASCILTCFDHNSSKSTNLIAIRISNCTARETVTVGELLIRIGCYFCYENCAPAALSRSAAASSAAFADPGLKRLKKRPDHNSSKSTNLARRTWEPRTARRDLFHDMSLAPKFVDFEEL